MRTEKIFAVVGGDMRQACLANLLARRESGHKIYGMFLEREERLSSRVHQTNDIKIVLPQSDVVLFPIPLLENGRVNTPLSGDRLGWEECLDYIAPEAAVIAGRVPPVVAESARRRGIEIHDYLEREEFAIHNAAVTAEGAVEIALRETEVTLYGSSCLVTGYGRVGRAITRLLVGFGAKVYVAARSCSALAWAELDGAHPVRMSDLDRVLGELEVVFNTVPALILGEGELCKLKRYCLLIDLASNPGGLDFAAAKKLNLKTIWALSLPGKVAPVSAGEIMLNTAYNILGERGLKP